MISIYKTARITKPEKNLGIDVYFDFIKNGEWQIEVLRYQANPTQENKVLAPAATISGTFTERNAKGLIKHSGVICIDADDKDQFKKIDTEKIMNDPYVYAIHKSIGGKGYAIYFLIEPDKHMEAYLGLEKYLLENHTIIVDKSCKDVSRLRFVSYDPDIYINKKAKVFKKYLPKKELNKKTTGPIFVQSDFDRLVNEASGLNLFDDYKDYINCAFALSSHFGEFGRHYFHTLCQSSSKYDSQKADHQYSIALNRKGNGITIATIYYMFSQAGLKLQSEKTETIKKIAKLSENPEKELSIRGIIDEENLIDKFKSENIEQTKLDLIIELVKINRIRFNEIVRNYEMENEIMTDRILATFINKVWQKIDENISKEKIWNVIQDRNITPSYNPITEWFAKNKEIKFTNEFEQLCQCFKIESEIIWNDKIQNVNDYLQVFLRKWLIGIIASAHGTYSLLILVLIGKQRTDKSRFFRGLLPEGLQSFYSESVLDNGTDSEILMTKKLLILDDEFAGKSKKDANKLKRLSSQQSFSIRMPYGRFSEDLQRLAVLCGTSNDEEVINDPTGNRRIIPVNVLEFDYEKYKKISKDRLFIQLYHEWLKNKEEWFLTPQEIELLNAATIKNTEIMQEEELLQKHFVSSTYYKMTTTDIYCKIVAIAPHIKTNTKRIGQALKKLGYEQKLDFVDGKTKRNYEIIDIQSEYNA
jgi:predicted P-loop ATPase